MPTIVNDYIDVLTVFDGSDTLVNVTYRIYCTDTPYVIEPVSSEAHRIGLKTFISPFFKRDYNFK